MPQVILIDGILIFLLFPKLLLGSVSDNEQIFGYKGHGGYTASTASLGDATLGAKSVVNGI